MSPLRPEDLQRAAARATGADASLVETHISWVVLAGDSVFKVKKPVGFGFLDFTTREARERACRAEVDLNRRLAPDVYRGVVPVVRIADGLAFGGEGDVVDWAVHMRRLDDARSGEALLAAGALGPADLRKVARKLADLHESSAPTPEVTAFGSPAAIGVNVRENFAQTAEDLDRWLSDAEIAEVRAWHEGFLADREGLLAARMAAGRVRDGHGDLRLEHVYVEGDATTIIDCIEFNDRFRYGDVAADAGFLAMDLAWHRRVDLAELFLALYAEESNDFDLYEVVDFYGSYRAFVRGKIATFGARAASPGSERERAASEQARRYFRLAVAEHRRSLLSPMVVAVAGLIGSGKSTIAAHLTDALSAPAVSADRTRKSMLGLAAETKAAGGQWSGAYDRGFTERVYAEVLRRAEVVLASGRPVILDASFRSVAMRASARELAERHGVPFRLVECRAPDEVCLARLAERERGPSVSDGRGDIFHVFKESFVPITELPPDQHVVVETHHPLERTKALLDEALGAWPRGLSG